MVCEKCGCPRRNPGNGTLILTVARALSSRDAVEKSDVDVVAFGHLPSQPSLERSKLRGCLKS